MTKIFLTIVTVLLFLASPLSAAEKESKYLKAFPKAEKGMVRYVIQLPHKERGDDANFKVEIFVGQEIMTDGVNSYGMGGSIEDKPLKGWGFTYYEVSKFGPVISTQIAPPPGTPPVKRFVAIPSTTIGYNSRIPLVVYVPEGGEVRYRIWNASATKEKATKG